VGGIGRERGEKRGKKKRKNSVFLRSAAPSIGIFNPKGVMACLRGGELNPRGIKLLK
jgi:hypothetical protein